MIVLSSPEGHFALLRELLHLRETGTVGQWESGTMGGWDGGRMGGLEDGTLGRWEDGKTGEEEGGGGKQQGRKDGVREKTKPYTTIPSRGFAPGKLPLDRPHQGAVC